MKSCYYLYKHSTVYLNIRGDFHMVLCFRLFLAKSSVSFQRLAFPEVAAMMMLTSLPLWIFALLTLWR